MSSTYPNRLNDIPPVEGDGSTSALPVREAAGCDEEKGTDDTVDDVSDSEALALRAEKLKAIRKAIDAGAYDSDELLNRAMKRMRDAIEKQVDSE